MSFGLHTPETLIARSDSKDPATTCKGLTASGRPCRRALAASITNSPAASPSRDDNGVVAVLDEGDVAAFFCWQHKDQAEILVAKSQDRSKIIPLKQKSSIDTLVERIGVLDLEEDITDSIQPGLKKKKGRNSQRRVRQRDALPREWQNIQGPLMSVPEDIVEAQSYADPSKVPRPRRPRPQSRPQARSNAKSSWSCCTQIADEDMSPPPRRREKITDARPRSGDGRRTATTTTTKTSQNLRRRTEGAVDGKRPIRHHAISTMQTQRQLPLISMNNNVNGLEYPMPMRLVRPSIQYRHHSSPPNTETANLLSFIPPHLSPSTTSALLAQLCRPLSEADERGYIYVFWLTPETDGSKPDDDTASSLFDGDDPSPLSSPSNTRPQQQARGSRVTQALQRYGTSSQGPNSSRKILLKIGRATNVHRRLSQWTKQCGQNITLIRYYPYQRRNTVHDGSLPWSQGKRDMPYVHRVERLIHLELADKRVTDKGECEACGRAHKEWFEIDATTGGVRAVDEVIRRWVGWAEKIVTSSDS